MTAQPMDVSAIQSRARMDLPRLVIFALPWLPMAFIQVPLGMFIPAFYATNTTTTLAAVGAATGMARIFDAIIDPLIGHLSDRTRTVIGPRKPWVLFGTVLIVICTLQLFSPPATAGIAYYVVWSGGLFFAFGCVEIPMRAWASELSSDKIERARIFTAIGLVMALGSLVFWVAPFLAKLAGGTTALNDPRAMSLVASMFAVALPLAVLGAVAFVPHARARSAGFPSTRELLGSVRGNRPFWVYVSGLSVWSIGNAAAVSLVFIFLADYLQLGARVTPLMITYFVVQMIAMPAWVRLLPYIDKHRLIAVCWLLDAALKPALLWLEPGAVNLVFAYAVLVSSAVLNSISYTFPQAILADVVDFDTLRTRKERAASYFALNTLLYKVMMGVGAGIALPLLGAFGYTVGQAHDGLARTGMMVGIVVFPAMCLATAALIMWRFPIGSRRQQVIAARLAARERRAAAS